MEWLATTEFQYNDKRHMATGRTSFKLNFGKHLWKGNLIVQTEFPRLKEFFIGLQRSWKEAMKSMEVAQETIKKQFDKKQRNPQGLKVGDNVWLKNKNIHLNRLLKKLDQKKYRPFRVLKNIGLETFQLELPEEWMIYNMFNKDLLTRYNKLQFKGQHVEPAPPPTIINEKEEYEVEEV